MSLTSDITNLKILIAAAEKSGFHSERQIKRLKKQLAALEKAWKELG